MRGWRTRRMLALIVAAVFMFALAGPAAAHEVFFKAPLEGVQGAPVEVRLCWGHFPGDLDPESRYFAEIPGGRLYLLTPEGEEIDLTLEAAEDHYRATFVPGTGGDFQVVFAHARGVLEWQWSEPRGTQKVFYYAKVFVPVDGEPDIHAYDRPAGLDLEVIPVTDIGHFHVGDEFRGVVRYLGQPLGGVTVYVVSPLAEDSHGDSLELTTEADGSFAFTADAEGLWMIKIGYFDGERRGQETGQAYEGVRYASTTFFPVHGHDGEGHTHGAEPAPAAAAAGGGTALFLGAAVLLAAGAVLFLVLGRKYKRQ